MSVTVRDALHYIDTGDIEHRNTTNATAMEQFLDELELQVQIIEIELADGQPIGSCD